MINFLAQADLGTINPPSGTVPTGGNPTTLIASIIRSSIQLLLIASFVIALIWTIIAGLRFIFAGGDEKTISSAWSQIYYGLIGMAVVMGSYAIIRIVEIFFRVNVVTGNLVLPRIAP